jgi:hypothetical protein
MSTSKPHSFGRHKMSGQIVGTFLDKTILKHKNPIA